MDSIRTETVGWASVGVLNVHAENAEMALEVVTAAAAMGVGVTRFCTSLGAHDGYHKYVIYTGENRPASTRSRRVIGVESARFSRNYLPSIRGERAALTAILDSLTARTRAVA